MNTTYSILREEEYRKLARTPFRGSVLDIGGSTRSGYHALLKGAQSITTANINPAYGCDLTFDIQERFPIADNAYDHVVSLNVFEHIYRFHNAFSESARILRPGGTLVCATPFLFHVHGSPDDYFRYTKSALEKIAQESGFREIRIEEIGLGLFSLMFQMTGGAVPTHVLRQVLKKICIGIDAGLLRMSKRYRMLSARIPLGYFCIAKK